MVACRIAPTRSITLSPPSSRHAGQLQSHLIHATTQYSEFIVSLKSCFETPV